MKVHFWYLNFKNLCNDLNKHHKLNISRFNTENCAKFVHFTHKYCALRTHLTHGFIKRCKMCVTFIHFISLYFTRKHIYSSVKYIFNAWHSCVQYMNLWMNELHMIFIINSSHVKFVMKFKFEFFSYLHFHPKDSKHYNILIPKVGKPI